ncbi:hypothetical protein ACFL2V_06240 [Pseudomonadota bacterium]
MDALNEPGRITWHDLKERCEKAGVRDDDLIDFVDVAWGEAQLLQCQKDSDFGWQIKLTADCDSDGH